MVHDSIALLLEKAVKVGASDVHVAVDAPILFRIDGELLPQSESPVTIAQAEEMVREIISDCGFERLQKEREIDASYALPGGIRIRVNCHFERGNVGLAARIIPAYIPTLEEVGMEGMADRLCSLVNGLVLFTGPTGSGKSTSLAAIINAINQKRAHHIITLEDPIEFMFPRGRSLIRQREYLKDFLSFSEALKRVLRQDPDIVMVGEMRDPETIAAALTLAETGHLILATLHTPDAIQAVDRIIDVFPPHQQSQVRSQLSLSLKVIIAQRLLPKLGGGRVALRETLLNTPAVAHIIRDNRTQELKTVLQTSEAIGMCTFEKNAQNLLNNGLISRDIFEAVMGAEITGEM